MRSEPTPALPADPLPSRRRRAPAMPGALLGAVLTALPWMAAASCPAAEPAGPAAGNAPWAQALGAAEAADTAQAYERFLSEFPAATDAVRVRQRNAQIYAQAAPIESLEAYRAFLAAQTGSDLADLSKPELERAWTDNKARYALLAAFPEAHPAPPGPLDYAHADFEFETPEPAGKSLFADAAWPLAFQFSTDLRGTDGGQPRAGVGDHWTQFLALAAATGGGVQRDPGPLPRPSAVRLEAGPAAALATGQGVVVGRLTGFGVESHLDGCTKRLTVDGWVGLAPAATRPVTLAAPEAHRFAGVPAGVVIAAGAGPATTALQGLAERPGGARFWGTEYLTYIDLDGDKVADLAWSVGGEDERFFALFANVAGAWQLRDMGHAFVGHGCLD